MTAPNDLLTVTVDPSWPQLSLWLRTTNQPYKLRTAFYDLEGGVAENVDVSYQNIDILGRAEGFLTYVSNSNRTVPMKFIFQMQGLGQFIDTGSMDNRIIEAIREPQVEAEVIAPTKWLDGMRYSFTDPNSGIGYSPPPVILRFGSLLTMRGVVHSCIINWFGPWTTKLLPTRAEVDVTFMATSKTVANYNYNGPERFYSGGFVGAAPVAGSKAAQNTPASAVSNTASRTITQ